jgi:hypothetical protein
LQCLIAEYLGGRNPQNGNAPPGKPRIATLVARGPNGVIVRQPIDLDSQPRGSTIKIEDIRPNRMLTAKPQARQPALPQRLPKDDFRERQFAA